MAVHFLHISKAGGTAIKHAIKQAGRPKTTYGPIKLHRHRFRLPDVPEGDRFFFVMRDPVARFVSSFYSRYRKGAPRYNIEWRPEEAEAFARFTTPQQLLDAMMSDDRDEQEHARAAMDGIAHLKRHQHLWLVGRAALKERLDDIVYIARQETLDKDWPRLREALGYPDDLALPTDEKAAHRGSPDEDRSLTDEARAVVRDWYAKDYRLLEFCETIRQERGWA